MVKFEYLKIAYLSKNLLESAKSAYTRNCPARIRLPVCRKQKPPTLERRRLNWRPQAKAERL
jgi:hypothetical protein